MNNIVDEERGAEIRHRAYMHWLAEGQPDGREEEHWRRATEEVDEGAAPVPTPQPEPEPEPPALTE